MGNKDVCVHMCITHVVSTHTGSCNSGVGLSHLGNCVTKE